MSMKVLTSTEGQTFVCVWVNGTGWCARHGGTQAVEHGASLCCQVYPVRRQMLHKIWRVLLYTQLFWNICCMSQCWNPFERNTATLWQTVCFRQILTVFMVAATCCHQSKCNGDASVACNVRLGVPEGKYFSQQLRYLSGTEMRHRNLRCESVR